MPGCFREWESRLGMGAGRNIITAAIAPLDTPRRFTTLPKRVVRKSASFPPDHADCDFLFRRPQDDVAFRQHIW